MKIFSRHLEDMTDKASRIPCCVSIECSDTPDTRPVDGRNQYPDVVSLVEAMFARSASLESFILDAEIVAIDPEDGSLRTFQELSNRARRDVKLDDVKVSVSVFAFDLMYLNAEVCSRAGSTARTFPLKIAPPPGGRDRSSWKSRSGCADRFSAPSSRRWCQSSAARRGSSTSRAARVQTAGKPSNSSGRRLWAAAARGSWSRFVRRQ